MSPKDLLVLHGEKALVTVVALICVWIMFGAATDPDIRASAAQGGMTADQIKENIAKINEYRPRAQPPILKQVPAYANRLSSDLGRPVVAETMMGWTTTHPDLGPTVVVHDFFYIYEALPPKLAAADKVGAVSLSLTLPDSVRDLDRIGDKDDVLWKRAAGGSIENHATILGAQIERKKDDTWVPVGKGMIPFAEMNVPIQITDVQDFGTYTFRARYIIAASGYRYGQGEGGSVIVHAGRTIPLKGDDTAAAVYLARVNKALAGDEPDVAPKLIHPTDTIPKGVELRNKESAYNGPWSDPVAVTVSSPIRFQLARLSPDFDADKIEATFLLTKLIREGDRQGWVEMQTVKVKKGDKLGGMIKAKHPLRDDGWERALDLSTPFELVRIERDVERILYRQIKDQARSDGKPGRELVTKDKPYKADLAVLKNTRTGEEVTVAKLGRITVPLGDPILDPPTLGGDEAQDFKDHPGEFVMPPLDPKAPTLHQPGEGPLEELHAEGDGLAVTDTPYYELSTGELIYYEPINKTVLRKWKLGVTPPAPLIKTPPVAPVPPAGTPAVNPTGPNGPNGANGTNGPNGADRGRRRPDSEGGVPGSQPGPSMEDGDQYQPPEERMPPEDFVPPDQPAPRRRR